VTASKPNCATVVSLGVGREGDPRIVCRHEWEAVATFQVGHGPALRDGVELVSTILLALAGSRMLDHVLEVSGTGASSAAAAAGWFRSRSARALPTRASHSRLLSPPKFAMALSNRTTA